MNIRDWIKKNIPKEGIIVEGGMADGSDTLFFSEHLTKGAVYAFEPLPAFFFQAAKQLMMRTNVKLFNKALSEKTQNYTLYVSDQNGNTSCSSSILKPKDHLWFHPQVTFKQEVSVSGVNLDDWMKEQSISKIDLLWLDIQGAEPAVLRAAPQTLPKIRYIYTEVSLIETYETVLLYKDLKVWMTEQGFEVVFEDLPWKDMGNVLFRNTKHS
jgi:FkbM family methyltransferase